MGEAALSGGGDQAHRWAGPKNAATGAVPVSWYMGAGTLTRRLRFQPKVALGALLVIIGLSVVVGLDNLLAQFFTGATAMTGHLKPRQGSAGPPAWELWCPSPLKEWSPCRVPWHVFLLTFLLPLAGCVAVITVFLLIATILNQLGAQKTARSKKAASVPLLQRQAMQVLLGLCVLGLLTLIIRGNLQSAWIGADKWASPWYMSFIGLALSNRWYKFGLDPATDLRSTKLTFIDVGARTFQSSPTWFIKNYPRGAEFDIIAFELDPGVKDSFKDQPHVELRTEAVGTQNKQIRFEIAGIAGHEVNDAEGGNCSRCVTVQMIDFAEYLTKHFERSDYVAVKVRKLATVVVLSFANFVCLDMI